MRNTYFLFILQIWQEQFNQVLVQKLDSAVHLHDLNDLLNATPPFNKWPKFSTLTTPPAICISKNMPKTYLNKLNDVEHL